MFLYLLILIAIFSVLTVGMIKLTMYLTGRTLGKAVEKFHREAEFIVNTGMLPESWTAEISEEWTYERYGRYIKKKFGKMTRYFQRSPVFEDEEARDLLLENLADSRKILLQKETFSQLFN